MRTRWAQARCQTEKFDILVERFDDLVESAVIISCEKFSKQFENQSFAVTAALAQALLS